MPTTTARRKPRGLHEWWVGPPPKEPVERPKASAQEARQQEPAQQQVLAEETEEKVVTRPALFPESVPSVEGQKTSPALLYFFLAAIIFAGWNAVATYYHLWPH